MTSRLRLSLLALATVFLLAGSLHAQQASSSLQQSMGATEFHRAGLDKLDPQQLQNLEQWLAAHAGELAVSIPASQASSATAAATGKKTGSSWFGHKSSENAPAKPKVANDTVVSRIAGSFKGWSHGSHLRLENGQEWKVSDDSSLSIYKPLEHPEVTIKPGLVGGWSLKVKGYNTVARVEPVN